MLFRLHSARHSYYLYPKIRGFDSWFPIFLNHRQVVIGRNYTYIDNFSIPGRKKLV